MHELKSTHCSILSCHACFSSQVPELQVAAEPEHAGVPLEAGDEGEMQEKKSYTGIMRSLKGPFRILKESHTHAHTHTIHTQDHQNRIWLNRSASALRMGQGLAAIKDANAVLDACPEGHAMVPKALYRLGNVSVHSVCCWSRD